MNDREKYIELFDLTLQFYDATPQIWCGPSSEVSGFTLWMVAAISTMWAVPGKGLLPVLTRNYLHMKKIMGIFACVANVCVGIYFAFYSGKLQLWGERSVNDVSYCQSLWHIPGILANAWMVVEGRSCWNGVLAFCWWCCLPQLRSLPPKGRKD